MKHFYRTIAVAALVSVAAAGAAAQTPVYVTGGYTGIPSMWDPANPVQMTYSDGLYTLALDNVEQGQQIKLSTDKGSWDAFNAAGFGMSDDNVLFYTSLNKVYEWDYGKIGNIYIPASGNLLLTVDMEAKTLIFTGEGTINDRYDVYLRGDVSGWEATDAYKFEYVERNASGEQVYRLLLPNGLTGSFKVADASWGTVNYGADVEIAAGNTYEVYNNGGNMSANIEKPVSLTLYHNTDNSKSSWLQVEDKSGIADVTTSQDDAPAAYYNLQGVRVASPAHGLYIRVAGNTAAKVYVK